MPKVIMDGETMKFPFLKLPSELQLKIFNRLSYDEISRCRLICKSINRTCQEVLSAGFYRVERFHARSLQRVKSQLPRRESERRTHELARHSDILTSIETRLSLLSMTYGKYIESSLCCFIPGKVLDEMFRVLRIVNHTPRGDQAPRPHELLQELRDISSMAMEHFEEQIVPCLRDRINMSSSAANDSAAASLSTSALVLYAAASGSSSLLGLSTSPKNGARALSHQFHPYSDTCRRHRGNASFPFPHTFSIDSPSWQNQRYENLKRQYQTQHNVLTVCKRELAQLRTAQQRQKDKLNEMERRLNEHEQRFIDVLAQLRPVAVNNLGNGDVIIKSEEADQVGGIGNKRKRITQNSASTSTASNAKKETVARPLKRQKLDNSKIGKK